MHLSVIINGHAGESENRAFESPLSAMLQIKG